MSRGDSSPGMAGCALCVVAMVAPLWGAGARLSGGRAAAPTLGSPGIASPEQPNAAPGEASGGAPGGTPGRERRHRPDGTEGPRAQTLADLPWTAERAGRVVGAVLVPRGEGQLFDALKVERKAPGPHSVRLFVIPGPPLRHRRYALLGRVRTAGVEGVGYLEMWSHFPDRGRFFSRTLAPDGPLRNLSGTQAWRRFVLPFDAKGSPKPPELLEVNLVLPGAGTVWLGPLRLVDLEDLPELPMAPPRARPRGGRPPAVPPWRLGELWWQPGTGGWVGAVGVGLLGVFGVALYFLGLRPRRLRVIRQLVLVFGITGATGVVLGVLAVVRDQPDDVTYPFLLVGGLALLMAWVAARGGRRVALRSRRR